MVDGDAFGSARCSVTSIRLHTLPWERNALWCVAPAFSRRRRLYDTRRNSRHSRLRALQWFPQSETHQEVTRLLVRAAAIANSLGKPVRCWMSDKQETFGQSIAAVFPEVPHRYCANYFLHDLAKSVRGQDC